MKHTRAAQHPVSEIPQDKWTDADWEDLHNTMRALQDRVAARHGLTPSSAYYMVTGYNAEGREFVAMPIQAASATAEMVQCDALQLLEDAGYKCASATVRPMKTRPNPPLKRFDRPLRADGGV